MDLFFRVARFCLILGNDISDQLMVAFTVALLVAVHGITVKYPALYFSCFGIRLNLHRVSKLTPTVRYKHLK